jgi:hypothetical protein
MPQPDTNRTLTPLLLDFVEWIACKPRPYHEVMDAWRTSCPRLTIWEDCLDGGLVACRLDPQAGQCVECTPEGLALLERSGRIRAVANWKR